MPSTNLSLLFLLLGCLGSPCCLGHEEQDHSSLSPPQSTIWNGYSIPNQMESPFGSYPNPLHITQKERESFHPVVIYPKDMDIPVLDLRFGKDGLASEKEREAQRKKSSFQRKLVRRCRFWMMHIMAMVLEKTKILNTTAFTTIGNPSWIEVPRGKWAIGKYDENRVGFYASDLFQDTTNAIDGYTGKRTVHLGIDFDAPAGTNVYAFCDGKVHSAGYNPELGDYGNVVVIEHYLPMQQSSTEEATANNSKSDNTTATITTTSRTVWALYGHLDHSSVRGKKVGRKIQKGQVIGKIGDIHENGGWTAPHVHFQLSVHPPETHDMPGASSVDDRPRALVDYPDPRYVLGPVH